MWDHIRTKYSLFLAEPTQLVPTVVEGELRALALELSWGPKSLDQMEYALEHFGRIGIDEPDLISAYAAIHFACYQQGKVLSKNDLWIAATANFTQSRLHTCDRDFVPFADQFFSLERIDISTL